MEAPERTPAAEGATPHAVDNQHERGAVASSRDSDTHKEIKLQTHGGDVGRAANETEPEIAELLADLTGPSVAVEVEEDAREVDGRQPDEELQPVTSEPRSILNAVSDSSDGEDAAVVPSTERATAETTEKPVGPPLKSQPAEDDEEDVLPPVHGEKGVEYNLSELFINPNLRLKSANVVLKKDPFAIPRATDNVTEYRPRFNPLSILMSEEKLLPRNFTFDFSEGIPGEPKQQHNGKTLGKRGKDVQGRTSRSNSDFDASSLLVRKTVPPIRNPQVFGDKLSTIGLLMGSMPRQAQPSPTPLINTPTVHNPFGEPLLELVATSDPPQMEYPRYRPQQQPQAQVPLQPLPLTPAPLHDTLGAEFEAFGIDLNNISGLSKLSIAANAAAGDASLYNNAYGVFGERAPMPPPTPPAALYDGVSSYMPNHFSEKRLPPSMSFASSLYDVPAYPHADHPIDDHDYRDSFEETHDPSDRQSDAGGSSVLSSASQSDHDRQRPSAAASQSLQPVSKKPRSKNVFRPCTHLGCTKGARGKSGLCQKHGGGKRCATPNCPKGAQGSSKFCLFHGGGYRCTMAGCTTGARGTSGLCAKHGGYKRAREGSEDGHVDEHTEGGQAAKNPRLEYEGRAIAQTAA